MSPTLYMATPSPPVRAVQITAQAIGLSLNLKEMDLLGGENLKPEFLKLNPQHTVPVLDDDGFIIWDSNAIMPYLVSKYSKDDSLYPKDLQKRAIVDQRLHFNSGTMFARFIRIAWPLALNERNFVLEEDRDKVLEAYGFLEALLEGKKWAAGDFVSIADYGLVTSVGSVAFLVPIDPKKYPNLSAWLERVEALPECEVNKKGKKEFGIIFGSRLSQKL